MQGVTASQKVVIPAEAGITAAYELLKILISSFCRNDLLREIKGFRSFDDTGRVSYRNNT